MPRPDQAVAIDFAFFVHLLQFYKENRARIRRYYKDLSKKFLDFNDPENSDSFLRQPQFEALEMYVFLKEYLNNDHVHQIFKEWMGMAGRFEGREQLALFESINQEQYERVMREWDGFEGEWGGATVPDSQRQGSQGQRPEHELCSLSRQIEISRDSWWESEPSVGRVAHGVPSRVDCLRGLGNAIVPQIAEALGRMIMEADYERTSIEPI